MKEAILLTDGYKLDHRRQYPENTEYVYSNWTPRSCHYYPEATEGAKVLHNYLNPIILIGIGSSM